MSRKVRKEHINQFVLEWIMKKPTIGLYTSKNVDNTVNGPLAELLNCCYFYDLWNGVVM